MALADILARIEADAAGEAAEIVAAAEAAAMLVAAESAESAERLHATAVEQARREARRDADTLLAGARLSARDRALGARAELIDEVMELARRALADLDDEQYARLLAGHVASAARGGERILLGGEDRERLRDRILPSVSSVAGERAAVLDDLAVSDEGAPFARGLMLVGSRVRTDISLEAIVAERRGQLEMVVADVLFPAEEQ